MAKVPHLALCCLILPTLLGCQSGSPLSFTTGLSSVLVLDHPPPTRSEIGPELLTDMDLGVLLSQHAHLIGAEFGELKLTPDLEDQPQEPPGSRWHVAVTRESGEYLALVRQGPKVEMRELNGIVARRLEATRSMTLAPGSTMQGRFTFGLIPQQGQLVLVTELLGIHSREGIAQLERLLCRSVETLHAELETKALSAATRGGRKARLIASKGFEK